MADAGSAAVDDACAAIADAAYGEGMSTMLGMCGNNGQLSIIESVADDYASAAEAAAEGEFDEISSDHDEAVGAIIEVGNEIMAGAAEECARLRAAEDVADLIV